MPNNLTASAKTIVTLIKHSTLCKENIAELTELLITIKLTDQELKKILVALNEQCPLIGTTGWQRVLEWSRALSINLFFLIKHLGGVPTQFIAALTKPDKQGHTALSKFVHHNQKALKICLMLIEDDAEARTQFLNALSQCDPLSKVNKIYSYWVSIFNSSATDSDFLQELLKYYPDETYAQFSSFMQLLQKKNDTYSRLIHRANDQPVMMELLRRFSYEQLVSAEYNNEYQSLFDNKALKSAIISHIKLLAQDEKNDAIKTACTPGLHLNQLLANENDFLQLMEIYYNSIETATLVQFIQNTNQHPSLNLGTTVKQLEILTILNNYIFSAAECDAILNVLNMKTCKLNRSGWSKIAIFAPAVLFPLLQKISNPENLPTQLINILAEPDTNGNTPLHTLAYNDHLVFMQSLKIIAISDEGKEHFLNALSQENAAKTTAWTIIFKELPPVLSKLEELYPEAVIAEMEKYFKSSLFNKLAADRFIDLAVKQPSTMDLLTRFLYKKLTEKMGLNSKYVTFINNSEIQSLLIKHILNLSEDEKPFAFIVLSNKQSNLYQCLKGHESFKLLAHEIKTRNEAQNRALLEAKRAKSLAEKAEKKARNKAKNENRQLVQPSKININAEKESIYHNLVTTVHDSNMPVITKINACCNALDQTTENGKILSASERSLSLLLSMKPDTLSQVLTLVKEDLIPQINTVADAEMLKRNLTVIQRQLELNKSNSQLGKIIAQIDNRCKIIASLSTDINLHDIDDNASVDLATQQLASCWHYLYPEINETMQLFNSADKKAFQVLLDTLNHAIVSPRIQKNKQLQALDHHYAIEMAARPFNQALQKELTLAKFAGNPKMKKTMEIVCTLTRAKTLFDMRDFLYKETTGLSIPKVEQKTTIEIKHEIPNVRSLKKNGIFNSYCLKNFLSEEDLEEVTKELDKLITDTKKEEKEASSYLENDLKNLMEINAPQDKPVKREKDQPKAENKVPQLI